MNPVRSHKQLEDYSPILVEAYFYSPEGFKLFNSGLGVFKPTFLRKQIIRLSYGTDDLAKYLQVFHE